jgi:type III secretory pathway component EscR
MSAYGLIIVLATFVAVPDMVHAEERVKKTEEHLEEAIKSAREGSAQAVVRHTEEARKYLIEQNKEHPYTNLQKSIYGERKKAGHDKEIFEAMEIAIGEAREGYVQQAVEALEQACIHLREKEQAK